MNNIWLETGQYKAEIAKKVQILLKKDQELLKTGLEVHGKKASKLQKGLKRSKKDLKPGLC